MIIDFTVMMVMIKDFIDEYARYKITGEKAIEQVPDAALNCSTGSENNSIAVIVRHINGNLTSRFTDFLASDGEKPFRDRDSEFERLDYTRQQIEKMWNDGWSVLEHQLGQLGDDDLVRPVYIRGKELTVHEALCRSVAHVSYHIGQIVLIARHCTEGNWNWISIPRGESRAYNLNPTKEKAPE